MKEKSSYTHRLERMLEECREQLRQIGIEPAEHIFGIKENKRAKKRLGCCRMVNVNGRTGYELEISSMLETADDEILKDVIYHELLHTCRGCMNHGARWKALADKVNRTYGTRIRTRADYEELDLQQAEQETYRYEISCTDCGAKNYRMRRSRIIDHPENYRCGRCGGKLRVRKL